MLSYLFDDHLPADLYQRTEIETHSVSIQIPFGQYADRLELRNILHGTAVINNQLSKFLMTLQIDRFLVFMKQQNRCSEKANGEKDSNFYATDVVVNKQ